jgi:hypothetical protein
VFLIVLSVFTDLLPSNRRPIVARVGSRKNIFTESLPSNGSIRHNIIYYILVSRTQFSTGGVCSVGRHVFHLQVRFLVNSYYDIYLAYQT